MIIEEKYKNMMLRDYLRKVVSVSTGTLNALKKREDGIKINGVHETVRYRLCAGDTLELEFSDTEADVDPYLEKADIPLDVICENEDFIIVNKPPFMPTHTSHGHRNDTLANALANRYSNRPYVFRAVSRLDANTSGLVLCANNRFSASLLSAEMKEHKIHKTYIAVVSGRLEGAGTINIGIRRADGSIMLRCADEGGEYAVTEYKSLAASDKMSVIEAKPLTGRTHQLRVHFSYISHPIIGDGLYSEESPLINRQALHASRLEFDGKIFEAPLPEDMKKLIAGIK